MKLPETLEEVIPRKAYMVPMNMELLSRVQAVCFTGRKQIKWLLQLVNWRRRTSSTPCTSNDRRRMKGKGATKILHYLYKEVPKEVDSSDDEEDVSFIPPLKW